MEDLKKGCTEKLPAHLRAWVARKWIAEGEPADKVAIGGCKDLQAVVRAG